MLGTPTGGLMRSTGSSPLVPLVRKQPQSETTRLLAQVNSALGSDDINAALRYADRLWRNLPHNPIILHLYGRVLGRHGDFAGALVQLVAAARIAPSPEIEANVVEALLKLNREDEALLRHDKALKKFAATPELGNVARSLCARLGPKFAGWVGISPELEVVGEILGAEVSEQLEILTSEGGLVSRITVVPQENGIAEFSSIIPFQDAGTLLTIKVREVALIGNDFPFPPTFDVNGRSTTGANAIKGWVSIGWIPSYSPNVLLKDTVGAQHTVKTKSDPARPGRHEFELDLGKVTLKGPEIEVFAVLPGGGTELLPDSPMILENAITPLENSSVGPSRRLPKAPRKSAPPHGPIALLSSSQSISG